MSGDAPVLDHHRFEQLRLPGPETDEKSLAALVQSFASSSQATIDDIRREAEGANWPGVAALAHRLKGASALLGAIRLRDACGALQLEAKMGADPEELRRIVDRLAAELESVCAAMTRQLEGRF